MSGGTEGVRGTTKDDENDKRKRKGGQNVTDGKKWEGGRREKGKQEAGVLRWRTRRNRQLRTNCEIEPIIHKSHAE